MTQLRNCDDQAIHEAVQLLRAGQVVAIPTETVYGLAADSTNKQAIDEIYRVKGRPSDNPLIEHVSGVDMLINVYGQLPKIYKTLLDKFWPGPLTIILNRGHGTVAVRCPSHPVALSIIEQLNRPVSAPSANLSTKVSPTRAEYVMSDLNGLIPLVVRDPMEDQSVAVGLESTVIDAISFDVPYILRPGGISIEQIRQLPGYELTQYFEGSQARPSTPGMKYKHYSPKAQTILYTDKIAENINGRVGIIKRREGDPSVSIEEINEQVVITIHDTPDYANYARNIFECLRILDERELVDVIYVQEVPETELGAAVMNRLRKACV